MPSDDCIRARKSISAQLDGELSELGSFRLAAHLRRCPACALHAQEARAVVSRLRAAPLERPAFALTRYPQSRTAHSFGVGVAAAVAVAAGAILAVAGVVHQGTAGARRPAAVSAPVSAQRLKQQRLLALLSTLDSASSDREARLVAL